MLTTLGITVLCAGLFGVATIAIVLAILSALILKRTGSLRDLRYVAEVVRAFRRK